MLNRLNTVPINMANENTMTIVPMIRLMRTMEFMEKYILAHNEDLYKEFLGLTGKSNNDLGLTRRGEHYMTVKKWFLESFPEIAEFENRAKNKAA